MKTQEEIRSLIEGFSKARHLKHKLTPHQFTTLAASVVALTWVIGGNAESDEIIHHMEKSIKEWYNAEFQ